MKPVIKTKRLNVKGMTCVSCQNKIERKLRKTAGVRNAHVSYSDGIVEVSYDTNRISIKDICAIIKRLGYQVIKNIEIQSPSVRSVIGILIVIVSLFLLLQQFGILNLLVPSQLADTGMGYGMLFVIGLLTSIHCIAMCGGINVSQCVPKGELLTGKQRRFQAFRPALLYNIGRVTSYTVIGFLLGFAGLVIGGGTEAGLPVMAQGILKLFAGAFMVIVGINMLGLFPALKKLQPRIPKILSDKIDLGSANSKSPLIVGMFNGLMPCGPLQSMQIVALASGNPLAGALSMFLFSLGTVPLMLGLGSVVAALGKKFTQKVMNVGATLVVVLGLAMLSQGGSLSGFLPPDRLLVVISILCVVGVFSAIQFKKPSYKAVSAVALTGIMVVALTAWTLVDTEGSSTVSAGADNTIKVEGGKQFVTSTLASGRYPNITVQAGTPVEWTIDAPQGSINGCNSRMVIRDYGIEYSFEKGENLIEFTPQKAGRFQYSCWMGMIRGTITVLEEGAEIPAGVNGESSQT
jgi:sulfite exporter TauE/SafE/copper chaperone CopZ